MVSQFHSGEQDLAYHNQVLAQVSQAIAETQVEYQPLLDVMTQRISELMGDMCVVRLLSPDGAWLEGIAGYHPDPAVREWMRDAILATALPTHLGLGARMMAEQRTQATTLVDLISLVGEVPGGPAHAPMKYQFPYVLFTPLRLRGRFIGTMSLARSDTSSPFSPADHCLAEAVADRVALAVENARLYRTLQTTLADSQRYAARLERVYSLLQAVLAADAPDRVAQTALEYLGQWIPYTSGRVVAFDFRLNRILMLAGVGVTHPSWQRGGSLSMDIYPELTDIQTRLLKEPFMAVTDLADLSPDYSARPYLTPTTQSFLRVLLIAEETLMGVLMLEADTPGAFTAEHLTLVREISGPVGLALAQGHLRANLQHKEVVQRQLLARLMSVQETERKRVARELHDDASQALGGVGMAVAVAAKRLPPEFPEVRRILDDAGDVIQQTAVNLRRIVADLRPTLLDDLGLIPALARLGQDLEARTRIAVTLDAPGGPRLSAQVELALFRLVQEALSNVARHAQARRVTIRLTTGTDSAAIQVIDDGVGFHGPHDFLDGIPAAGSDHFGLMGMYERVALLNGRFGIDTRPGAGTTVWAILPLAVLGGPPAAPGVDHG